MNHSEPTLSISEAQQRVEEAVNHLEEAINQIDHTPGKRNEERRQSLASILMSILASKFVIQPDQPG